MPVLQIDLIIGLLKMLNTLLHIFYANALVRFCVPVMCKARSIALVSLAVVSTSSTS